MSVTATSKRSLGRHSLGASGGFATAVGPTLGLGAGSCPQGARASTSDLRPSRTRATGAPSPRRLTRRSCREPSAAPSERWRIDRPQDARLRPRRRAHAVPVDDTSSSARSARVQAPRPLRMAHLLSSQPQAERLQVSRPQLSVTPAISGAAARRSGGRGSNPTSRDRAVLGVVDCSTRAWFVPAWWAHRCEAPRARRRALETSFRPTPMARRAQLFGAGLLRVCRVCRAKCKVGALGQESRRAVLCVCVCGDTLSVELVYQPLNHQAQGHEIDPARPAAVAAL